MIPNSIKETYALPEPPAGTKPYMMNLDFGGREIVRNLILSERVSTVLEIGSFLGGSAIDWLKTSPLVKVVCVDVWSDWPVMEFIAGQFEHRYDWYTDYSADWEEPSDEIFAQLGQKGGFYATMLANVRAYRGRIFPVQAMYQNAVEELAEMGLRPDLVYLDADKDGQGVSLVSSLFPGARITGDDYRWPLPDKVNGVSVYPVMESVNAFAREHNLIVVESEQTWALMEN